MTPQKKYRSRNPEKRAAHQAVFKALVVGTLMRQPCERCGAKAEAHHDDYSKPLEVMWLCRKHHRERHEELRGNAPRFAIPLSPRPRKLTPAKLVIIKTSPASDATVAEQIELSKSAVYQIRRRLRTGLPLTGYSQ